MSSNGSKQQRSAFFSAAEQEVLMRAYQDYRPIFLMKSNTTVASREREMAWQKIADRVNASNPGGVKRTWQQIKIKHKNILQTANRRKLAHGGSPTSSPFAPIEHEILESLDGIPGDNNNSSASSTTPQPQDTNAFIIVTEGVIKTSNSPPPEDESPSAAAFDTFHSPCNSREPLSMMPVKELYKVHLEKQIKHCDLDMDHIQLKIRKTQLEIELLEYKLKDMKK